MFFDGNDGDAFFNPEIFHVVHQELFHLRSTSESRNYVPRNVPTHTEDGIPIRKLYVSNLPPKTTRTELFGVFAQYGFIKSCWIRIGERGPNRAPSATYAFVTFSNPEDAHKALQAPVHEKSLRGRNLRISPADSWHQPSEDADGRVRWKPSGRREEGSNTPTATSDQDDRTEEQAEADELEDADIENNITEATKNEDEEGSCQEFSILDVLNHDCLSLILTYVPIRDLIRSERVSKHWQMMVQEHLQGMRTFKTSWWQHVPVTLTTAVLRRVLQRLGASLLRLHIDHYWPALNDRTAHTVGKFCPMLEEFKVVGMNTKNWNPLMYGCKQLKTLYFVSCNRLTDSSLVNLVKNDSSIENLTIANNTHVTGLFLTASNPLKLSCLAFYNCYSLQGTVLSAAIDTLPSLSSLKLDVCPYSMWKIMPLVISKLPRLVELSLSEYSTVESFIATPGNEAFCKALSRLKQLKILNLDRNIFIDDAVMKTIAQNCHQLESLNVSCCNSRKTFPTPGVTDAGVAAVCGACPALARLDVSYLARLSDAGLAAAAQLPQLQALTARGLPALSAAPFVAALRACPLLEEVDACGCDGVSEAVVAAGAQALRQRARRLRLYLAATAAADPDRQQDYETHELMTVNWHEDRSNPHLRPDFVDPYDGSTVSSIDDLFDHEDLAEIDDFIIDDDAVFLEENGLEEYDFYMY